MHMGQASNYATWAEGWRGLGKEGSLHFLTLTLTLTPTLPLSRQAERRVVPHRRPYVAAAAPGDEGVMYKVTTASP